VSGHLDALDHVQAAALERGALKAARLAVSGAFHTVSGRRRGAGPGSGARRLPPRACATARLRDTAACRPQTPTGGGVALPCPPPDPARPPTPTPPPQRLMAPARAALEAALASADVRAPRVPVWSNVTGAPFPADPSQIRALLARQLVEPVRWEATLGAALSPAAAEAGAGGGAEAGGGAAAAAAAAAAAPRRLFELGPGQQLKAMVRRVSGEAWKSMVNAGAA
jgi:hypothetical protein